MVFLPGDMPRRNLPDFLEQLLLCRLPGERLGFSVTLPFPNDTPSATALCANSAVYAQNILRVAIVSAHRAPGLQRFAKRAEQPHGRREHRGVCNYSLSLTRSRLATDARHARRVAAGAGPATPVSTAPGRTRECAGSKRSHSGHRPRAFRGRPRCPGGGSWRIRGGSGYRSYRWTLPTAHAERTVGVTGSAGSVAFEAGEYVPGELAPRAKSCVILASSIEGLEAREHCVSKTVLR